MSVLYRYCIKYQLQLFYCIFFCLLNESVCMNFSYNGLKLILKKHSFWYLLLHDFFIHFFLFFFLLELFHSIQLCFFSVLLPFHSIQCFLFVNENQNAPSKFILPHCDLWRHVGIQFHFPPHTSNWSFFGRKTSPPACPLRRFIRCFFMQA